MNQALDRFFGIRSSGSSFWREIVAGLTTFITVSYIVVVNPKILEAAGLPVGASLVATAITAAFGTLAMGLYARRPFAVAPYMGENAFFAFTVVGALGFSWQVALGGVFWAGILFVILTLTGARTWLANAVPPSLKAAFAVGIGLFLAFLGLMSSGIVRLGVEGAPVHVADLRAPGPLIAIGAFFLMVLLTIRKVPGALILGIAAATLAAWCLGLQKMPESLWGAPPDIMPIFAQADLMGALAPAFLPVLFTMFILDFLDTVGTLYGLGYKAGLVDKDGKMEDVEKPMLCDAASTVVAGICGTTTSGVYIESASGIQAGGRTGLVAVVCGLLFLAAIPFAPLVAAIPSFAYGPVLIFVGMMMLTAIRHVNLEEIAELVPAFLTVILMCFTLNLGIGITAGLVSYPLCKIAAGKIKEVRPGTWLLAGLSALFFVLYPY